MFNIVVQYAIFVQMVFVKRTFVCSICNVSSFRLKFRKYLTMQCANCLGYMDATANCIGESVMGEREIYIERNLFVLTKRDRQSILSLNKGLPSESVLFHLQIGNSIYFHKRFLLTMLPIIC